MNTIVDKTLNGDGDSDRHLTTLFGMVLGQRPKRILELGVRGGSTTLPLLMAAKAVGAKVVSVDVQPTMFQCPDELLPHWEFVQMDALKYLAELDKSIVQDFVYVDDWHSYPHVAKELSLLDECVTPSSVVVLHDCMYGTTPFYHSDLTTNAGAQWEGGGPYRAVAELNPQFWEFATMPWNNGLTILRKKYSSRYHKVV
jgi:predicted O-methyltransferase YrrM